MLATGPPFPWADSLLRATLPTTSARIPQSGLDLVQRAAAVLLHQLTAARPDRARQSPISCLTQLAGPAACLSARRRFAARNPDGSSQQRRCEQCGQHGGTAIGTANSSRPDAAPIPAATMPTSPRCRTQANHHGVPRSEGPGG
jgi:hypothetical protein